MLDFEYLLSLVLDFEYLLSLVLDFEYLLSLVLDFESKPFLVGKTYPLNELISSVEPLSTSFLRGKCVW